VHPVVSVAAALAPLGARRVDITTWESAADRDRAGIDALTEETRAVFTMQDREPTVFPGTLAFNVLGADDARDRALEVALEASKLEVEWSVTRLLGPSYAVETAVLQVELSEPVELDAVRDHLEAGRALRVVEGPYRALDTAGRDDVRVAGLRADGTALRLVLGYDRLRRGAATQVAWLLQSWRDRASK
jgi:aspartate-semialdehyde dehydrogenase